MRVAKEKEVLYDSVISLLHRFDTVSKIDFTNKFKQIIDANYNIFIVNSSLNKKL